MRTDSTRVSDDAVTEAREFIGDQIRPELHPDKPNIYKSKKDAQDAHEAVRPSSALRTPDDVANTSPKTSLSSTA